MTATTELTTKVLGTIKVQDSVNSQFEYEHAAALMNIRNKVSHVYFYLPEDTPNMVGHVIISNGGDQISASEAEVFLDLIQLTIDELCEDCSEEQMFTLYFVSSLNCLFNNRLFNPTTH